MNLDRTLHLVRTGAAILLACTVVGAIMVDNDPTWFWAGAIGVFLGAWVTAELVFWLVVVGTRDDRR